VLTLLREELDQLTGEGSDSLRYDEAAKLVDELVGSDTFPEFLTVPAYALID
jgi:hypothetical protein